jgi:endonuclease/exonuclease/phosphatase family metal-dependent hydrolase
MHHATIRRDRQAVLPVDVRGIAMHLIEWLLLWMIGCAALTFSSGCSGIGQLTGQNTVRVMSYNIHHGVGADSVFDISRIADVIRHSDADIVALQDVDRTDKIDMMTKLADLTGMTYTFVSSMNVDGGEHGNGLLTRFPILEEKHLKYRMQLSNQECSLMRLVLDVRGTEIVFMNTELNGNGIDSLQASDSAEIIASATENQNVPVILGACMNSAPNSKAIIAMSEVFRDSWTIAGSGDGFTYPANSPEKRFDYIFVSKQQTPTDTRHLEVNLKPVKANVLESNASTHLPLLVALKVVSE